MTLLSVAPFPQVQLNISPPPKCFRTISVLFCSHGAVPTKTTDKNGFMFFFRFDNIWPRQGYTNDCWIRIRYHVYQRTHWHGAANSMRPLMRRVEMLIMYPLCALPTLGWSFGGMRCRISAGGSCASILFGKLSLGTGMQNLSPQHLGEGEALDEDVAREVQRVDQGGADGSVVKVQ